MVRRAIILKRDSNRTVREEAIEGFGLRNAHGRASPQRSLGDAPARCAMADLVPVASVTQEESPRQTHFIEAGDSARVHMLYSFPQSRHARFCVYGKGGDGRESEGST